MTVSTQDVPSGPSQIIPFVGSGGTMNLVNDTIASNTADNTNEFFNFTGGAVTIQNTILGADPISGINPDAGNDVAGTFISVGGNLVTDATGSTGFTGPMDQAGSTSPIDPMLGPLANNGGPTETMALLPGSPAIDGGLKNGATPLTDQRGVPRDADNAGTVDIGAFEVPIVNSIIPNPLPIIQILYGSNSTPQPPAPPPPPYIFLPGPPTIGFIMSTFNSSSEVTLEHILTTLQPKGTRTASSVIEGMIFEDYNGNGIQDPGEPPAAGQIVYLDLNNNGVRDPGEPWTITGPDGRYRFNPVGSGVFVVRMEASRTQDTTAPKEGSWEVVVLKEGTVVSGVNFGFVTRRRLKPARQTALERDDPLADAGRAVPVPAPVQDQEAGAPAGPAPNAAPDPVAALPGGILQMLKDMLAGCWTLITGG